MQGRSRVVLLRSVLKTSLSAPTPPQFISRYKCLLLRCKDRVATLIVGLLETCTVQCGMSRRRDFTESKCGPPHEATRPHLADSRYQMLSRSLIFAVGL